MKFSTAILGSALVASALAAPLTEKRAARRAARSAGKRQSNPPFKPGTTESIDLSNTSEVEYSSNWAGAVLIGTGYNAVTAEFTVPTPSVPSGGSNNVQYCASAWVGIDGDTCSTAILQTGIDFCVQGSTTSFDAWYEWYPDYAYDFNLAVAAGDVIKITVDATSKTAGTATVDNVTTGKSVTHTFTGGVDGDLCEYNAEWIVEDFEENGSLVPFANFGTVTFSSASATSSGSSVGPEGATLIDIESGNTVLTSVSVTDSTVVVKYV